MTAATSTIVYDPKDQNVMTIAKTTTTTITATKTAKNDGGIWRDLVAYWILGMCNNYGYVVMLSAAHDIIHQFQDVGGNDPNLYEPKNATSFTRQCNIISTGTVLLADVLPSLFVKIVLPFFPFWIHVRIASAIILAIAGFIIIAFADSEGMALLGVICTSASSGIGETSFLGYSSAFDKNVISCWSSGTGGAGIVGSVSYATLRSFNITPTNSMLIMLIVPIIEAIVFWGLLRRPQLLAIAPPDNVVVVDSSEQLCADEKPLIGLREKFVYIRHLFKYMIPLALVYFFEYFINQGLFELVYFENSFLDKASQYRWLNVDYQIGVFISRSSVNLFTINKIWLMSVFQLINAAYFLTEAIYWFTPTIWIIFTIVLWEGLLGGGAYVNTFYRMSKEISAERRKFAMGMVVQSDSIGIALAGFLAIPTHNAICQLAEPVMSRLY